MARLYSLMLVAIVCCSSSALDGLGQGTAASIAGPRLADDRDVERSAADARRAPRMEVLSEAEWKRVDGSVDRALRYLASQQQADGSFVSTAAGQPAVTSLCVMAFLSAGHQPGIGPYGPNLDRAVEFVLTCQRQDGLFSYANADVPIDNNWGQAGHTATYNHAISGLMLGEVFGQTSAERARRIRPAINLALQFTRRMQERPKHFPVDFGGVRYIRDVTTTGTGGGDADLSVTAWHLMFYRSAKNAGFEVPQKYVDEMLQFVNKCYDPATGGFRYSLYTTGRYITRGMTGAGVLSLFLAGHYDAMIEAGAGQYILQHPFRPFKRQINTHDRYFYSAYYCSQAAMMLGGAYWEKFYPELAAVLMENQRPDGSWPSESEDADYGSTYSTSLVVLSLTPPYQLLPIYQR